MVNIGINTRKRIIRDKMKMLKLLLVLLISTINISCIGDIPNTSSICAKAAQEYCIKTINKLYKGKYKNINVYDVMKYSYADLVLCRFYYKKNNYMTKHSIVLEFKPETGSVLEKCIQKYYSML